MNIDRRLTALALQQRVPFTASLVAGTLAALMLIAQAALLSRIIDGAFRVHASSGSLSPLFLVLGLASILRLFFSWIALYQARQVSIGVKRKLNGSLAACTASLGPQLTRSMQSGSLSATLTKGVEALDAYFSQYLPQLYFALAIPLLILASILFADPASAGILLLSAPLIPLFMVLIGKSASAMTDRQWQTMSRMSGYFLDRLQGLSTLKLFGRSKEQRNGIEEAGESFRRATMQVLRIAFLSSLTLELTGTIGTAVIAVGVGMRLLGGHLAFQPALFVLLLTPDFYFPLRQLGMKFHAGKEGVSASKDIFALLDKAAKVPSGESGELSEAALRENDIVFRNVSYTYPGAAEPALDRLTCTFPAGKTTAVTGPNGSGKSTMINLLLRFMEPEDGAVTVGETPISSISMNGWLKHLSWVPQHPFLFNATIRENLLLAKESASDGELLDALSLAGLDDLLKTLPEGLSTSLGEQGTRFSGGEAQRLALARAFLKNAPVQVLDEPTSNTDPLLERSLRTTLNRLMEGRTVIIIAHRQETIRSAHQTIVLQDGTVTESGTHDGLMAMQGYYRSIRQPAGEIET